MPGCHLADLVDACQEPCRVANQSVFGQEGLASTRRRIEPQMIGIGHDRILKVDDRVVHSHQEYLASWNTPFPDQLDRGRGLGEVDLEIRPPLRLVEVQVAAQVNSHGASSSKRSAAHAMSSWRRRSRLGAVVTGCQPFKR